MALLTCDNLTLGYENITLVRGLSFSVNAGDYLCIVGENGTGKSTLMRTLLHLQEPLSGTIRTGDGLLPHDIGYLPQQTVVQRDFPASVREIVLSGCQGKSAARSFFRGCFYSAEDRRLAAESMKKMDVTDLADRCYRELSGGQQQRVLLARALCATGKLLLLDEPVSGLDPRVTTEMYDLIEGLNREGVAIIMISHDLAAAMRYASHILYLGDDVFFGPAEDFPASPAGRRFGGLNGGARHA